QREKHRYEIADASKSKSKKQKQKQQRKSRKPNRHSLRRNGKKPTFPPSMFRRPGRYTKCSVNLAMLTHCPLRRLSG
ncbi:hypothetical protein, partial [Paraburkholderia sabiae]|uniref:hypothetical protein n=1 Tax=Paraburkholderia sabiae TaxID=273251 RepID=UPI003F4946FB